MFQYIKQTITKNKIKYQYIFMGNQLQAKVEEYKGQSHTLESRLSDVNDIANQSQFQLNQTTQVIKSLEERQKTTEVCKYSIYLLFIL